MTPLLPGFDLSALIQRAREAAAAADKREINERQYLRSLKFTDSELDRYRARLSAIELRYARKQHH